MATEIPIEFLRECFSLDAEEGLLFWKHRPFEHFENAGVWKNWCIRWAGRQAGHVASKGYYMLSIRHQGANFKLFNHRIIWALYYGEWPRLVIDHLNRVRADNRIANLRDVTQRENNLNRPYRAASRTDAARYGRGFSRASRSSTYRAYIYEGSGKTKRQIHLGTFKTESEAAAAHARAVAQRAAATGEAA